MIERSAPDRRGESVPYASRKEASRDSSRHWASKHLSKKKKKKLLAMCQSLKGRRVLLITNTLYVSGSSSFTTITTVDGDDHTNTQKSLRASCRLDSLVESLPPRQEDGCQRGALKNTRSLRRSVRPACQTIQRAQYLHSSCKRAVSLPGRESLPPRQEDGCQRGALKNTRLFDQLGDLADPVTGYYLQASCHLIRWKRAFQLDDCCQRKVELKLVKAAEFDHSVSRDFVDINFYMRGPSSRSGPFYYYRPKKLKPRWAQTGPKSAIRVRTARNA